MYTRSYTDKPVDIPDGYGGTAVPRCDTDTQADYIPETAKNPWEDEAKEANAQQTHGFSLGSVASGLFSGLFPNGRFNLQSIGFEEILIIVAAAYMLMSRDGDRECGIMLLILLFIS